jgi:hypothetical protein
LLRIKNLGKETKRSAIERFTGEILEEYKIFGLTYDEMKKVVQKIKAEGRAPFFHYTHRAGTILNGPLVDDIIGELYATFDKQWHQAFIVPYKFKQDIENDNDL